MTHPAPTPPKSMAGPSRTEVSDLLRNGEQALAAGDHAAAARAFRGAAYLAPGDPVAHLQLGLVLEQQQDAGAARAFRAAWRALEHADRDELSRSLGDYRAEELVHLVAAKLSTP